MLNNILFYSYDYFLVSQTVREGTISPTSYNVIEDTTGMHPDRVNIILTILTKVNGGQVKCLKWSRTSCLHFIRYYNFKTYTNI